MNFSDGLLLHLLWLIPLAALALIVHSRRNRKAMERFAEPGLLPRIAPQIHGGKRFIKAALLLLALTALVFALAGPRWGSHYQEVSRKGVDIMLAVDVSASMMVEDIKPTRLERARREIIDFLKVVAGDRVGLAAFAGAGFVQCPLTLDYAALEMFLSALQPGLIPVQGTDLGAAIDTSLSAFDFKAETDKVIMLITDGEDNENRGLVAARHAAAQGVKIFVFGIGDPSGGPIPAQDGQGGFKKDAQGKLILSKLDESGLQNMASVTGGTYVRSVVGDLDLDLLYFDGIKKRTEARELKGGKIKVYEERFAIFALIAFFALFLEGLIDDKKKPPVSRTQTTAVVLAVLILLTGSPVRADDLHPDDLYRAGRFDEAAQAYAARDMDHPKDLRYRYNRGCAAYQAGQFQEAAAAFSSVLRRTDDNGLRYRSAYNLGNTALKQQDLESAVAYYKQALNYRPDSEDARYNLELALRTLEKMKDQQKDQEKQNQQKQDQKNQDQPSDQNQKKDQAGQDSQENKQDQDSKDQDPKSPDSKKQDQPKQDADQKNEQNQDKKGQPDQADQQPADQKQPRDQTKSDTQNWPKENEPPQNLDGDLKNKQEMPAPEQAEQPQNMPAASIDKKKAEALLENMKEDPSRFMQLMIPQDKRNGVSTGKDW